MPSTSRINHSRAPCKRSAPRGPRDQNCATADSTSECSPATAPASDTPNSPAGYSPSHGSWPPPKLSSSPTPTPRLPSPDMSWSTPTSRRQARTWPSPTATRPAPHRPASQWNDQPGPSRSSTETAQAQGRSARSRLLCAPWRYRSSRSVDQPMRGRAGDREKPWEGLGGGCRLLDVGRAVGESGVPAVEVIGELVVEDAGADLE